jgi:glycine/D-amino acid oxidase-like deaminating enzyme
MRVLICGGGVIGASIAYFLSRQGAEAIVIEKTGLACAASGKSGGFLALDWCDGSPLEGLARRSFALHGELGEELGAESGYRRLVTYGGVAGDRVKGGNRNCGRGPTWVADTVHVGGRLGTTDSTAQVNPGAFTAAMMRAASGRGAQLRTGTMTAIVRSGGRATGVEVDGERLEGDAVVIAMGPWSLLASQWMRLPVVFGLKGHSLIFDTGNEVPAEALFLEYEDADGTALSPEIFPRPDGTTYVCGLSSQSALPVDPAEVTSDPGALERLQQVCCRLSPVLAKATVIARQACYRPVTQDGLPLIGPVQDLTGAYVATGHSVWGILNAPATGEALAELILEGAARRVDLAPFDPARLQAFDAARLSSRAR